MVDSLIRKLRPGGGGGGGGDRSFDRSSAFGSGPSGAGSRSLGRMRPISAPMRAGAVWGIVSLGVLLGIALPQWPYARACGSWLLLYLTAVGTVLVAGLWGARVSWRSRMGLAHVIAVTTIIWGLALTTHEVLPRVGYAKVRLAWRCHDGHAFEWPKLTPLFTVKEQ